MQSEPDSIAIASAGRFAGAVQSETAPARARPVAGRAWALVPIVTASGFAGLGYEIVWTRQLSLVLGTEMMAVLGVIAGFFGGLALGAFALDRPIRRATSPWRVYAMLEAVIAVWGLISVWLLPAAGRALAPLLGTEPSPALLWAGSLALPTLVLLPATMAMGGTLAALERLMRDARGEARVTAGVYGANTAGALAGTLVSTFLLIPALGFSGTLLCLAAVNALCALGALALGSPAAKADAEERRPERIRDVRLTITLFATGLLGITFEVLVVRLAAQVMEDTVYTFAGLLAAYLLGTAAGSLLWQRSGRDAGDENLRGLLAATALACIATAALAPYAGRLVETLSSADIFGELAVAIALFLVPATAMGALFGLLAQRVSDQRGSVGAAVGINSLGACIAPLLAAQFLIPALGAWTALLAVAIGYLLLLPPGRSALLWSAVPAIAALILWLNPAPSLTRVPPGGALLAVREGPMATASVVDDAAGVRYLEINGHFRMGGTSSTRSDYRQAMLPLLLHEAPHHALFLGIGTGATMVGGAQMPGVSVRAVELSREVVELLPWFVNPPPTSAPLVTVADARRYVAADTGQHDVIIADLFHPALDGSGALYTVEHFAAVKRRLAPGGIFCQWLPLYQLDMPSLRAIVRGFLEIYPDGAAWLNHYSVRTPMLALIGTRDGGHLDTDALAARLRDPAIAPVVRPLGFEAPIDILGQYVAGPHALSAFAGEGPRNTDDYPFVTFDARRNVRALTAAPWSLLLAVTKEIRPDPNELLARAAERDALGTRLNAYWAARNRFLEAGASLPGDPRGAALIDAAAPGLIDALRLSAEFDPAYGPLMGMAKSLLGSDRATAARLLRRINEAAPSRREARDLLLREFGLRNE
ncbi:MULTISPECIES: spermidine synthase [Bradyrhizobium]|uniref:spermidine synthase n=1 Tax=Bradyrhizobium TaxID=374 RepID=UPI0004071BEC|nr:MULTISPECIES: spermidine synthase [Bradyrhizobium]QOG18776.1 spermidine synthase [Bradyrhizobium sp. SEMIA]UFW47399.1 spermidine synthase [Bradyrhizobium arachidis]